MLTVERKVGVTRPEMALGQMGEAEQGARQTLPCSVSEGDACQRRHEARLYFEQEVTLLYCFRDQAI